MLALRAICIEMALSVLLGACSPVDDGHVLPLSVEVIESSEAPAQDRPDIVGAAPRYDRALDFGPRMRTGEPFRPPLEWRDCAGGYSWHRRGEGWFEGTLNGRRIVGIASVLDVPDYYDPGRTLDFDFYTYDFRCCLSYDVLRVADVDEEQ